VWSFYEDPRTDAFLRAAYAYFTGEKDAPASGMLERLQLALSGDLPHVLILDGLERVQSEGGTHRRGELEDLQLKRFVRALAGGLGSARAVVTSRFPLVDLDDWSGAGHRAITLDDLELPVALEVLRAWGVKGGDDGLIRLIEPLNIGGTYHALSVAALGSYLGNFADGDPKRGPEYSPEDLKDSDPKARRLTRILDQYKQALSEAEGALLARLSLFPRGVKVELLCWIVESGGEVAGALIGLADRDLVNHLERLKRLGLVFRYMTGGQAIYSAHPFLRDFFRRLLETRPESVHESVRARLAPSLESRPSVRSGERAVLDQYELLIEQTLLAGRVAEAFELYQDGLGGYEGLGLILGENTRGLRILERFVPRDEFSLLDSRLSPRDQSMLINALGLFAQDLGELHRARLALAYSEELDARVGDREGESIGAANVAGVELRAGAFRQALDCSIRAVRIAEEIEDPVKIAKRLTYRAACHFALGDVNSSVADFDRATELNRRPLETLWGSLESDCKFLRGNQSGALLQARTNLGAMKRLSSRTDVCRCQTLLSRLLLPGDPAGASAYLDEARAFASRSGHVELQLRCLQSACELYIHLGLLLPIHHRS
jgi:tetratricopeptide (TPR) repeat protein